jgi:hypothetical protein
MRVSAVISRIAFFSIALAASSIASAQGTVPTASPSSPAPQAAPHKEKEGTRVEELFIWKASEELRLPPEQELKFAETVRELNARRRKATDTMDQTILSLANAKTKAEAEKLTANYKSELREVHAAQIAELDQLKKVLGAEKLARYLVVKNQITDKLKTLISK